MPAPIVLLRYIITSPVALLSSYLCRDPPGLVAQYTLTSWTEYFPSPPVLQSPASVELYVTGVEFLSEGSITKQFPLLATDTRVDLKLYYNL